MTHLLEVRDLSLHFPIHRGFWKRKVGSVQAVDGISFALKQGETFGIVGESGCGKSSLARAITRLYQPSSGHIFYQGSDVAKLKDAELMSYRRDVQMVFQDPYASLNPRKTVGWILEEPMRLHRMFEGEACRKRAIELLERVGLRASDTQKYPHEFSGGQRQRIGIARALALTPKVIICDEAVSALDVSIQAQIINLLVELQRDFQLTYVFISHDLNVVRYISDRVAVMYLGRFMELGEADRIYQKALHPYTQALMSAAPIADPEQKRQAPIIEGDVPSPSRPPQGCPFHTRCPQKQSRCQEERPQLRSLAARDIACHFAKEET